VDWPGTDIVIKILHGRRTAEGHIHPVVRLHVKAIDIRHFNIPRLYRVKISENSHEVFMQVREPYMVRVPLVRPIPEHGADPQQGVTVLRLIVKLPDIVKFIEALD
jgi:hypothetical protein